MSDLTYNEPISHEDKDLVWLQGEITTPPFSLEGRREAGALLRQLQQGVLLALPHSRPMPVIGVRCHELRIPDRGTSWRIMYRIEPDAVVILEVFAKKTPTTPMTIIRQCQARLARYLRAIG